MRIKLEELLNPSGLGEVNLFIVSKKKPQLKKMSLAHLTQEEKLRKLQLWSKDQRFVAVVERGDMVFAFSSPQFAENLKAQNNLTISGKKVEVEALSEPETDRLNAIIETFEEYIRLNPEDEIEDQKDEDKAREKRHNDHRMMKENLARTKLLSAAIMDFLILEMRNVPHKIKLAFLRKMEEARKESDRLNKEADVQEEKKYFEVKQNDLKKRIVKENVIKEEIKKHLF